VKRPKSISGIYWRRSPAVPINRVPRLFLRVALLYALAVGAFGFQAKADTDYWSLRYSVSETNLELGFDLVPDNASFFTLSESTNLALIRARLTSLGGGTNAWRFMVLDPRGGPDPEYAALGGGTNVWNFAVSPTFPSMFWRIQRSSTSPSGTYFGFHYSLTETDLTVHFDLTPDLTNYYILDAATDLTNFSPVVMAYGGGPAMWSATVSMVQVPKMLWRVRRVSAAFPFDTDRDGLDDFFELSHGLNPLDPTDASSDSGLVDANNNPLTWLQAYHYYFVNNIKIYDSVSREVSAFNFGQPTANYEALSREVSAFNTPLPDTNQDGIDDIYEFNHGVTAATANLPSGFTTDFPNNQGTPLTWQQLYRLTFGQSRTLYDTVGREVSVFNFGQPTADYEAISREVSVFNVPVPDSNGDGIDDAYAANHGVTDPNAPSGFTSDFPNNQGTPLTWLQLYRLNFGANRTLYDTISREVSVFNFGQPTANFEAISREVSVFNFGQPTANYEAISREVSVFNEP